MNIENNLKISLLLEIYGKLLTQKQCEILDEFYNDNISISEIATNHNSSRQAVNDLIKRSVNVLNDYEQKLGLLQKFNSIKEKVSIAITSLDSGIDKQTLVKTFNEILEDV